MRSAIKILVAIGLIIWFCLSVDTIPADQIVSTEKIKMDTTVTEIKIVSPDEVQRLETERDREFMRMRGDIEELKLRVAKLESQNNQ